MTRDEIADFLRGVRSEMGRQRLSQKALAKKAGTTNVTISRYLGGKGLPSHDWIENVCSALGKSETELILEGKPDKPSPPGPKKDEITILDLQVGFAAMIEKYNQRSDLMRLWLAVFEELPTAALLIKDGIVTHQNTAAKELGIASGGTVCDNCDSNEYCFREECAINMSIATGIPQESYNYMGNRYFHVLATPFRHVDDLYYICTVDEVAECGEMKDRLDRMTAERLFISQCPLESPQYYADKFRRVSYVNQSFLNIFGITREELKYTEDFISMLNSKLFSPKKITTMAEAARSKGIHSDGMAKLQSNEMVWFCFIPHVVNNQIEGVMVLVMDEETYAFRRNRGEII